MNIFYRIPVLRKLILLHQNFIFNCLYREKFGNKVIIFGYPIVFIKRGADVKVGKNLTLISHSFFSEPGINHPVIIRLLKIDSKLEIGSNVGISGCSICVEKEVIIEKEVMLGANVSIADTDFHQIKPSNRRFCRGGVNNEEILIRRNVFVGMNSIILKGVTIGENSVIGAGSVVSKSIPANVVAGGNPCKVIREMNINNLQDMKNRDPEI